MSRTRSAACSPEISSINESIVAHEGCHIGRSAMADSASVKKSRARRDGKSSARSESASP